MNLADPNAMIALVAGILLVPTLDQSLKSMLRGRLGAAELSLGPLGRVQRRDSRIWIVRLTNRYDSRFVWTLWLGAATPLALAAILLPGFAPFAGLILGGSLSHALESVRRGMVSDYIHLPFWPAFNLADVAITGGAAGLAVQVVLTLSRGYAG